MKWARWFACAWGSFVLAACGSGAAPILGAQGEDFVPPRPAPTVTAATGALLAQSDQPDGALAGFLGEVAVVFDQEADPAVAAERSTVATLDALQTAADFEAYAASLRTSGDVFALPDAQVAPLLSAPATRASALCTENSDPRSTVLYYVNGILTTHTEALIDFCCLVAYMQSAYPSESADIRFRLFHNRTGLENLAVQGICDFLTSFFRTGTPAVRAAAQRAAARCNSIGGLLDIVESAQQFVDQIVDVPDPAQVADLRSLIQQDVQSGKRVILVGHSQGNFFIQQALDGLAPDGTGSQTTPAGVVAVASPTSYGNRADYGAWHNEMLVNDAIQLVPGSPPPNLTNALARSAILPSVAVHAFRTSYLAYVESRQPMLDDIRDTYAALTNPRAGAGQGYLQVTLTWDVAGDVDLYVTEPTGDVVYFSDRQGDVGQLDRDDRTTTGPENYFVCDPATVLPGTYSIGVNNYAAATGTVATINLRAGAVVRTFQVTLDAANSGANVIPVAALDYDGAGTFTVR